MLMHEAKIIRVSHGIPQHLRDEAARVLKLHAVIASHTHPDEMITLSLEGKDRANKILLFNLLLACDDRSWLPARGTWVWI